MTPNGIVLYSLISAFLDHHQRNFLWKLIGTNMETHIQTICRVRPKTLSPAWDISLKYFPSGFRELCGKGDRKNVRARGIEDTKKTRSICWKLMVTG